MWLLIAASIAACAPAPTVPYQTLTEGLGPLRDAFNKAADRTRLLVLVAPTWQICLRGVSEVHDVVLSREPDPRLQPLVIWVPKVRGRETHIGRASESVPDARVQHFWDGSALLMNAYQDVLGLPEDAWDMFLVYPPGVRWEGDLPPAPQFWMHQLGPREKPRVSGPYLDPPRLARVLDATLDGRDEADPDETDGDARPRD